VWAATRRYAHMEMQAIASRNSKGLVLGRYVSLSLSLSLSVSSGSEASLRSSIRKSVSRFRDVALCDVGRTTRPTSRGRGYSVATVVLSLSIDNDTNFSAATDNATNFLLGNCFEKKWQIFKFIVLFARFSQKERFIESELRYFFVSQRCIFEKKISRERIL